MTSILSKLVLLLYFDNPWWLQMTQSDRLIDAIVYRLYGLTEDEIAIVQGTRDANVEGINGAIVEGKWDG